MKKPEFQSAEKVRIIGNVHGYATDFITHELIFFESNYLQFFQT